MNVGSFMDEMHSNLGFLNFVEWFNLFINKWYRNHLLLSI